MGEKIARLPRKFSTEAWGKNRVVQYIPPGGEKHEGGGRKDYERRPVQLGVSLLSLSPGDTPAS
jgi:hypothetical protein